MIPTVPSSWINLSEHPSFEIYKFGDNWREWYEGEDPDDDLSLLRECAEQLVHTLPNATVELIVLDDLTTFVRIFCGNLRGDFGIGCQTRTFYLYLDPDPSKQDVLDAELDNLTRNGVVEMVLKHLA